MRLWSTKSGASISSRVSRSPLACASRKRRTRALFSSADIECPPCQLAFLQWDGTIHDATRRALAHCLEHYSPECVEGVFSEGRKVRYRAPKSKNPQQRASTSKDTPFVQCAASPHVIR